MSKLDPNKLFVEFREGVTPTDPIIPRKYTLTHSDITADLFLTIGDEFAYDKINFMRDEVLGEWSQENATYYYFAYLYIGDNLSSMILGLREQIFRKELPLALEAIRYGDADFFEFHPFLDNAEIIVYFISSNPEYNKVENWGTFSNYIYSSNNN